MRIKARYKDHMQIKIIKERDETINSQFSVLVCLYFVMVTWD